MPNEETVIEPDHNSECVPEEVVSIPTATEDGLEASGNNGTTSRSSHIGRTCEAFFSDKWFNSVVVSSRHLNEKELVTVKLLGTDQAREYDVQDVRFLPVCCRKDFPIGKSVQAIWNTDGLWYNGTIASFVGEGGFQVQFNGFEGEPETVPADQIREPIQAPVPVKAKKEEKTYTTPAGYVIPEKYKIDTTRDSAAAIEEKKRKIHQLKSQQRTEKHTDEVTGNVAKWQQFQTKVARR